MRAMVAVMLWLGLAWSVGGFAQTATAQTVPAPAATASNTDAQPRLDPSRDALLYRAIVAEALAAAADSVQRSTDHYWALASTSGFIVIGILGFLGYRQLADIQKRATSDVASIRETASREIEQRVRAYVDSDDFWRVNQRLFDRVTSEDLRAEVAKFENQEEVFIIQGLTKKLQTTPSEFTTTELEELHDRITKHAAKPNVLKLPYFQSGLNALLKRCYFLQDYSRVRMLEALFGDRLVSEGPSTTLYQLILIYAMLMLGELSALPVDRDRFKSYCLTLRSRNELNWSGPFYLPYILHFEAADAAPVIEAWLADLGKMGDREVGFFTHNLEEYSDPTKLGKPPQPHHYRLTEKLRSFTARYQATVDQLRARTNEQQPDGARQSAPDTSDSASAATDSAPREGAR